MNATAKHLPGDRSKSGRKGASAASELAVRAALTEYTSLRQEMMSAYQYMAAAITLALSAAGAVASLAVGSHLGGQEAPLLLVAAALILMMTIAIMGVALHVRTIAVWLNQTAGRVRAIIDETAENGATIPAELMGWEVFVSRAPGARLRGFVWAQIVPLPFVAALFQLIAGWDLWNGRAEQAPVTIVLLLIDVAISVTALGYAVKSIGAAQKLNNPPDVRATPTLAIPGQGPATS